MKNTHLLQLSPNILQSLQKTTTTIASVATIATIATTATTTTTISGLCKIVKGNLSFFLKNQAFTTQNQSNYKK
jgi:hypothetical protein